MKLKRLILLLIGIMPLLMVAPAYAYIEPPTSINIDSVYAYRNLAESGDTLIVFHYEMPYTSDNWSTTPASEAISLRLFDTDNTTVMITGAPYVNPYFGSNGYGDGVGAFYFASADDGPDWNDAVTINIYGWPAYFEEELTGSYQLTSSDYVTETTQAANRELLKNWVLLECDKLAADYEDSGIILKSTSDMGIVLSPYGELYFRGAINGLQNLCPELFFIQVLIPEQMEVDDYDMSLMDTYTGRLADDDLGDGFNDLGDLVGVSGIFAASAITFVGCLAVCIFTVRKGWGVEPGMILSGIITICMALIVGDVVFVVMMLASLAAAMGLAWLIFLRKA